MFPQNTRGNPHSTDKGQTEGQGVELEVLRVKAALLTAQLEREQDTVADLRRRLDRAEERIFVLSHSPAAAPVAPSTIPNPQSDPKPTKRSLWAFLRRS